MFLNKPHHKSKASAPGKIVQNGTVWFFKLFYTTPGFPVNFG